MRIAPSYSPRTDSSASRLSISRSLVGSSRSSTSAAFAISEASMIRRRSPPENARTGLSAASPLMRMRPKRLRAFSSEISAAARTASTALAAGSSCSCEFCAKYAICDAGFKRTVPRSAASSPLTIFRSVDFPEPFGPTIAKRSPRSTSTSRSSKSGCAYAFESPLSSSANALAARRVDCRFTAMAAAGATGASTASDASARASCFSRLRTWL